MKTTLKRGMGRVAAFNGDGRAIFPPGTHTPMTRYRQPDPPKRGAWALIRIVVLWTVLAALVVAGGAGGAGYLYWNRFTTSTAPKTKQDKAAAKVLDVPLPNQPTNALLIGTDRRKGREADNGRSDTLMLVRADPQTNSISLLSFPRDLLVPIHCSGHYVHVDRINSAFSECGSLGSVETVRALTGLPINYFITVNFHGFLQLVDHLGGVWMDVDHRYFNNHGGPGGYSTINLWPGYQRLNGSNALAYVRYRHFDSDLYRVVRQQLFLKALKQQITTQLSLGTLLSVVDAVERNVIIGSPGGGSIDFPTLHRYVRFAQSLPGGHIFQARIEGLTGYSTLTTGSANITAAVNDFARPDVSAPQKASDVTLGVKRRTHTLRPASVTVSVLNGNGITGSAANAAYELAQRGYKILLPADGKPRNALNADGTANYGYFNTTVYYDGAKSAGKLAASQLANLFGDAVVKTMTPEVSALANGAMTTVVVGQNFHGTIAPAPVDHTPKPEPPAVGPGWSATFPNLRAARHRVHFRLEVPRVISRGSEPEPAAPIRIYRISKGHVAVRLSFQQTQTDYWGIEETDWNDAPILNAPSFEHRLGGRVFDFYYSGPHLHMVVLKENGASYWVINTVLDSLSNETMLAIAKSFSPLPRK